MAEIQNSQGEYKPLAKVEELEEANYNMIDNVLNNMPPKKEPYLEYFATECDEFHDMGAYEKSTDVNQIAAIYENIGRIQKLRILDARWELFIVIRKTVTMMKLNLQSLKEILYLEI